MKHYDLKRKRKKKTQIWNCHFHNVKIKPVLCVNDEAYAINTTFDRKRKKVQKYEQENKERYAIRSVNLFFRFYFYVNTYQFGTEKRNVYTRVLSFFFFLPQEYFAFCSIQFIFQLYKRLRK